MKKFIIIFAILIFFITSFGETIQVVTEEYPPFNYSEYGVIKGVSTDIVKAVFKEAGIDYNIKIYPWARAYKTTLIKKNQILYTTIKSKKREKLFKWVGPIVHIDLYIFKLKSRKNIIINSIEDINKYRIEGVRDDITTQYLQTFDKNIFITSNSEIGIKHLLEKHTDLFPYGGRVIYALMKKYNKDPNLIQKAYKLDALSTGGYMAFNKDTPDYLVKKLQNALDRIKKNGTYDKIFEKWNN
ncbi:substrate-binding periplasmic protein [Haliovirga abyssi]|uniref:Solute-binding protein family 3/N-terminal domain-containing protein n=1 Tax=Haliovirga abyssi TaxID=2996794 RepID=A0AAU9DRB7_9FUSO|nr:transporter substrate-binding domain-containing protein [Haliovirga abyssi]BDU51103.1 hypothetical protein HLVA_16720 [Haliovirga abyssi]